MLLLALIAAVVLPGALAITSCQSEGPEYWCASCENAKSCAPEIEGLLEFCQQDLQLIPDCVIPINYRGYAEGVTESDNSYMGYMNFNYFTDPVPDMYNYMLDGGYPGSDQFYGSPDDTVRAYNIDGGYYVSGLPALPAFEQGMLNAFEFNTAMQWGYSGEAKATTRPPIAVTEPTAEATEQPVTQTLQNPNIAPPVITRPLYNISAYVGQATVLSCEAESDADMGVSIVKLDRVPKKSWLEKKKKTRQGNENEKTDITAFLTIDHLDEVDGGWYVCMAINGGGRDRSLMYLDITDLCKHTECEGYQACVPDYTTKETSCSCPECDPHLEMVCGSNCKTYQNDCWLARDNCELGQNHTMMMHAPCPRVVPPFFTVEPSDVEVEEGHHLIMECHALSFPVPEYEWFKLDPVTEEPIHVGSGTQYKVDEAGIDVAGSYFCIASICEAGHTIKSRIAKVDTNEHNLSTKTKKINNRVCRVFGDPHIMSFDRNNFNFPGQCTYILNMDCELAKWSVYGKFENCSGIGMRGSCLESVTVVYESSAIELQRGWSINYLGVKIDFFETQQHEVPYFHFDLDENLNLHVTMENGATIIWDGLYSVQIKLAEDDNTRYCGLCGDGDGDKTNDFVSSQVYFTNELSPEKLGIYDFGDSWKIDPYSQCPEWRSLKSPHARCSESDMLAASQKCEQMFNHPLIFPCQLLDIDTDYYLKSCAEDLCTLKLWEGQMDPACGILSAYTSACRTLDLYIDDNNWRSDVGCASLKEHQDFVITTGCPKTTLVNYLRS